MYLSDATKFTHHRNADGTLDSVCLRCFITVDQGHDEEDLDIAEYIHVCDLELSASVGSITRRTLRIAA